MYKKAFFILFVVAVLGFLGFASFSAHHADALTCQLGVGNCGSGGGGGTTIQATLQTTVGNAAGYWNQGDIRGFKVIETPGNIDITNAVSWSYNSSTIKYIGMDASGNAIFLNVGANATFCGGWFCLFNISATYSTAGTTVTSNNASFIGSNQVLTWSFLNTSPSVTVTQGSSATISLSVNHPGGWTDAGTPATTVSVNALASSWPNGLSFSYTGSKFPGYICVANRPWCVANSVDSFLSTTITASSNVAPGTYYVFANGTVENNSPTRDNHMTLTDLGTAYAPIVITVIPKPINNLTTNPTSIITNAGNSFYINLFNNSTQLDPSNFGVSVVFPSFINWTRP
ncbi:MAG: hypothetical protein ACYC49_00270 [Ignavibacteriaceae bacterium]